MKHLSGAEHIRGRATLGQAPVLRAVDVAEDEVALEFAPEALARGCRAAREGRLARAGEHPSTVGAQDIIVGHGGDLPCARTWTVLAGKDAPPLH